MPVLTLRDIRFIHQRLSGEMMTYLSYAAFEKLKPGREQEHHDYLMGLSDRLDTAEIEAKAREG